MKFGPRFRGSQEQNLDGWMDHEHKARSKNFTTLWRVPIQVVPIDQIRESRNKRFNAEDIKNGTKRSPNKPSNCTQEGVASETSRRR